jgi:hypothetical protein
LLYEHGYHANKTNDLFVDARVLNAQRYLIREVVGYFRSHPALRAWQLGEGLERVRKPGAAAAVAEWLALCGEAVREQDPRAHLLGVVSARGLTTQSGPRPEDIAATCDLVGVAADPPERPTGRQPDHRSYVAYLHALTASLAARPVVVTSLGLPTTPNGQPGWINDSVHGRALHAYRAGPEEQAAFVEATLGQLHRAGARGAWLASYADYPQPLWRTAPLDRSIRERTLGLIDAEGREKPAAGALRAFVSQPPVVVHTTSAAMVDPESYWRDPKRSFDELWREFNSDME